MGSRNPVDPYRAYNFMVEIDGIGRAAFQECSGLDVTREPIDYREGTDKSLGKRKIPGLTSTSNITLKWGMTDDTELWDWINNNVNGTLERKNLSIVLLDDLGAESARWNLSEAWPTKWTAPSFNAQDSALAFESLEIVYEGLKKA